LPHFRRKGLGNKLFSILNRIQGEQEIFGFIPRADIKNINQREEVKEFFTKNGFNLTDVVPYSWAAFLYFSNSSKPTKFIFTDLNEEWWKYKFGIYKKDINLMFALKNRHKFKSELNSVFFC
jgi:hypothetical protein